MDLPFFASAFLLAVVGLSGVASANGSVGPLSGDFLGGSAKATIRPIENADKSVSRSPAFVQGRVTTFDGRGIMRAEITVINAETGATYRTYTSNFGYYRLTGLPTSELYFMTVVHKRYLFLDASVSFTLKGDLDGLDFTASSVE